MEKGFLNGRWVKEKEVSGQHGLKSATSNTKQNKDNKGVNKVTNSASLSNVNLDKNVSPSVDMFEASCGNSNDVNTDIVNLETPLESNKGEDINYNANVEPTATKNGTDVVVPMESIRVVSERFANSAYGLFLGKRVAYPVVANYQSAYLKKWDPDVNLFKEDVSNVLVWAKLHGVPMMAFSEDGLSVIATKLELNDTIVVAMPKLVGEGFYMYIIRVEYEWKPPTCLSCKVFEHVLNECPKKIVSDAVKKLNNPRQATRGVLVGPRVSFKSTKKLYIPVLNKNGASTSGKKKQAEVVRQEVSNSNPFDTINLIENDDDLGTNEGILKSAEMGSLNVGHDSESEVDVVFDETTNLMPSKNSKGGNDRGYGNNSMLEQCMETNRNDDYDPYDDDLYESHDMSDHLQAICDNLDITVRGRKKKHIMFVN
ncbi:hypothetical protein Tco_1379159 [Tanacetum coccineum]